MTTIDRVLKEVLGDAGASFLYSQLRRRHGLKTETIYRQIKPFREGMIELLGSGGEAILNMIVDGVAEELSVKAPKGAGMNFEERLRTLSERHLELISS